jgi:PAS domain S-box-containing protein
MNVRRFLSAPVSADEEHTHQAWVLHVLLWSSMVAITVILLLDLVLLPENRARWIMMIVAVDAGSLFCIALNHLGRTRLASLLLAVELWLIVTLVLLTGGGLRSPAVATYLLIVFGTGLLLGEIAGILMGLLCSLTAFVLAWLEMTGRLPVNQVRDTALSLWVAQVLYIVLMISLQFLATRTIKLALQRARRELDERKRGEAELRAHTERLNLAGEAMGLGAWEWDLHNKWSVWDRRVFELYGVEPTPTGTFTYQDWAARVHPEDLPTQEASLKRRIQEKGRGRREFRIVRPDGSIRWILAADAVVLNAAGEPERVVGVNMDVTERKLAEEVLQENEQRYSIVVEQTGQLVYDYDVVTGRLNWHGAVTQLTGFTPQELQKVDIKGWEEMIHPEEQSSVLELLQQARESVGRFHVEYRFRCKDGSYIWVDDHGIFLPDASGKAVRMLGTMSDITARKRAEAECSELTRSLEERVRLRTSELEAANEELEAFSYSVSHDLRGPLRTVEGFSQILLEDHGEKIPGAARELVAVIQSKAERMGHLISDLLTLSRLSTQPLKKNHFDLATLVTETAEELRGLEKNRKINISIERLPECYGDPSLLKQVFVNLLGNALKFTRGRPLAEIHVASRSQNGETLFFVRDNGAGFEMERASQLFTPFERLHSEQQFEGTGIGLSIVQRIIQRHGGRIWAEAAPDKGAAFYFVLPKGHSDL